MGLFLYLYRCTKSFGGINTRIISENITGGSAGEAKSQYVFPHTQ